MLVISVSKSQNVTGKESNTGNKNNYYKQHTNVKSAVLPLLDGPAMNSAGSLRLVLTALLLAVRMKYATQVIKTSSDAIAIPRVFDSTILFQW